MWSWHQHPLEFAGLHVLIRDDVDRLAFGLIRTQPFVPAQAGTQCCLHQWLNVSPWVPACAGTNG